MAGTALIISTYNWPNALKLCLKSVLYQSLLPDETIIADDGSGVETKKVITEYSNKFSVPLKHVWQEDKGFRKSKILNQAIRQTSCDYIIFIDGDIILQKDFIKDHVDKKQANTFISGSRVLLSENESEKRIREDNIHFSFYPFFAKNSFNGIRSHFLSKIFSKNDYGIYNIRGCNISFQKEDLEKVNGFDEQFEGWGREDSDIVLRMLNSGVRKFRLKFKAVQYHLCHPGEERNSLERNEQLLEQTKLMNRTRAKKGLA